uniref:Uncharacterized protein n=1 Tax=Strigamia maritima TaxID=126957 RepID=T1JHJ1_STRMM
MSLSAFSFLCRDSRIALNKQCKLVLICTFGIGIILLLFQLLSTYTSITQKSVDSSPYSAFTPSLSLDILDDVQYAAVIDAGSSGSRIYIYSWPPHTGDSNELLRIRPLVDLTGEPIMKKIEPGLSSVANEPHRASDYISPLLEFACDKIPPHLHWETPLFILATAGLRLLNSTQQTSILDDLRHDISRKFNFSFAQSNVEIISGKQEAVYQWMAINYAFERFNHDINAPLVAVDVEEHPANPIIFRKQTLGILDMGGASMQIGFELTRNVQLKTLQTDQRSHLAEFNLGCLEHGKEHVYHVYVTTYLGLGANEVLDLYEKNVTASAAEAAANENRTSISLLDPCFPNDFIRTETRDKIVINVHGDGQLDKCRDQLRPLLKNLTSCPGPNCVFSFITTNFESMDWIGFSEFWYSMHDVLRIGGTYSYNRIEKSYNEYCGSKWIFLQTRFAFADKKRLRNQCFKLAWIIVVLHDGLGLPLNFSRLRSSPNTVSGQV